MPYCTILMSDFSELNIWLSIHTTCPSCNYSFSSQSDSSCADHQIANYAARKMHTLKLKVQDRSTCTPSTVTVLHGDRAENEAVGPVTETSQSQRHGYAVRQRTTDSHVKGRGKEPCSKQEAAPASAQHNTDEEYLPPLNEQ